MNGVPLPWLPGTTVSWVHSAEVVLVAGCLVLLGLAPRIERSRIIPGSAPATSPIQIQIRECFSTTE